jgi:hypothetical protein
MQWEQPGANGPNDIDANVLSSTSNSGVGWHSWELTDAVQKWVDGEWINEGLLLVSDNESGDDLTAYVSSEYQNESFRPELRIEYVEP